MQSPGGPPRGRGKGPPRSQLAASNTAELLRFNLEVRSSSSLKSLFATQEDDIEEDVVDAATGAEEDVPPEASAGSPQRALGVDPQGSGTAVRGT